MELNQQFGPLRPAIRKGLVVEEEGEVFFLFDATDLEGAQIYKQQFGDKYFEILSGLKPGDQVITGPYNSVRNIADGDTVKIDNKQDKK